ncbi:MAG: hypothetical protein MPN21_19650 [Thermoanaerobaculia bacterium]|nr:hypothetical protein [Thermoanaerobaculia bacterium]
MTFLAQFLTQLRRDLAEWWLLWAAALATGFVPLLLPILYAAEGESALDLRIATTVVGGGLFWIASLALLGDGLAARDLAEGRFSFFVSRPLETHALWVGRVTAALILVAAIGLSLLLPTWLAQPSDVTSREPAIDPWTMPATAPGMDLASPWGPFYVGEATLLLLRALAPVGLLGLLLSFLLFAHLASTAVRSRDAWTLLDFGGFLIVTVLVLAVRDLLISAQAFAALVAAERFFAAATGTVLLVAGARQLAHGRTDLARGHGKFSRTAWPLLGLASLGFLGAAHWLATPSPDDLQAAERVLTTPDGRVALARGKAANRLGLRTGVIFSDEGYRAVTGPVAAVAAADRTHQLAWTRCRRLIDLDCEVWAWSSESAESPPRPSGIFTERWDHQLAWSPYGELLALAHDKLEVWQPGIEKSRLVFALERLAYLPAFLSATRLRFATLEPDGDEIHIEDVDLPSRAVRTVGRIPGEMPLYLVTSPSGRFVLTASMIPSRLALLDTASTEVRELQSHPKLVDRPLVAASFDGDEHLYLLTLEGSWSLVRLDLEALASGDVVAELTDIPLPPIRPDSRGHLGIRQGRLLISGATANSPRPRIELPQGVEPLADYLLWEQAGDAEGEDHWRPVAEGVAILVDPVHMAPQRDTATLLSGGGAVLRLGDEELHLVIPALPETLPGRPLVF